MPLYEVTDAGLKRRPLARFADLGMYERADLQRLLRDDVSALDEDLLVIAEEFGNWEDARRRIDLLALDKAGRLVVIELKRTDDGGHMELQAIRYAAMVSSMGFAEVADAYVAHRAKHYPAQCSGRCHQPQGGDAPILIAVKGRTMGQTCSPLGLTARPGALAQERDVHGNERWGE